MESRSGGKMEHIGRPVELPYPLTATDISKKRSLPSIFSGLLAQEITQNEALKTFVPGNEHLYPAYEFVKDGNAIPLVNDVSVFTIIPRGTFARNAAIRIKVGNEYMSDTDFCSSCIRTRSETFEGSTLQKREV